MGPASEALRHERRRPGGRRAALATAAVCTLVLSPAIGQPLSPSGLGAYVTVATDARKHGLSQVDDEAAVRGGVDYEHRSGLYAGGVLGNVDYAGDGSDPGTRDGLIELYAGHIWRGSRWSVTTTFGHYRYPGTSGRYNYNELSAVIDYDDRYFYRLAYTDDMLSTGYSAASHDIGFRLPLPGKLELSASVGRVDFGSPYATDYTHYDAGLSRLFGRFGIDLRRYETNHAMSGFYGSSTGEAWALSLSYAIRSGR